MICPKCGSETEGGLFCEECGARLAEEKQAPVNAEPIALKTNDDKWPVKIPILLLSAFAAALAAMAFGAVRIVRSGTPFGMITYTFWDYWLLPVFPLVGAILFFLRTKKLAFLTALPYLAYCVPAIIRFVKIMNIAVRNGYFRRFAHAVPLSFSAAAELLSYFALPLTVVLAIVFLLGMLLKVKPPVFAVIYLILAMTVLLISVSGDVRQIIQWANVIRSEFAPWMRPGVQITARNYIQEFLRRPFIWDALYRLLRLVLAVFTHLACFIALLCRREKKAI